MSEFTTADGTKFVSGDTVSFRGSFDAINAYINAGCPEPLTQADGYAESYPNGCPIIPESNG